MANGHQLAGIGLAIQAFAALGINQGDGAAGQLDSAGQFLTRPPAVEQGGAAAGHQHGQIGHDPVGRIARGDPDPVTLLHAVSGHQPASNAARGGIDLVEGQPDLAIDDEFGIAVLGAVHREIVRQRWRRIFQHGQLAAKPFDLHRFKRSARGGQRSDYTVQGIVEFTRHAASLSSMLRDAPRPGVRAGFVSRLRLCQKAPHRVRWDLF